MIKKSEIGDWKHSVENLGYAIVRFGIWNFVIVSLRNKKKSHVITTNDFQKTNYLKTNLLKQIKKYLIAYVVLRFSFFVGAKLACFI